jgi:peptidoglycan hydrolase-like protein with peptidoglycan-binding domain
MSCSNGAWTESCAPLGASSLAKYLVMVLTATLLVTAVSPVAALAGPPSRVHVRAASNLPVRSAPVVLTLGNGYAGPTGASRVRVLQRRLAGLGFAFGPIDGRYGPLTAEAVTQFQRVRGLEVDGIAGPQTAAALATAQPVLYRGVGYQQRHGSGTVRTLQRHLAELGLHPGPIDGLYGPLTTRAVERLQRAHSVAVDGIVGPETWGVLHQATLRQTASRPPQPSRPERPSAPKSRSAPRAGRHHPGSPPLPVTFVLLALVALGLITARVSYTRTRSRLRAAGVQKALQEEQHGGRATEPSRQETVTRGGG